MEREIMFLQPRLKKSIWGGERLVKEYPFGGEGGGFGECWNISAHPAADLLVIYGAYKGMTLSKIYREHRELFGNIKYEEFPLLVKIIDAARDLSVQVHPDDAYARQNEHYPYGKTEMWCVLDCPADATLIIGNKAQSREELARLIKECRFDELLCEVEVKKGDVIQIVPGTVHAIKAGFLILEIQQSSDITYRVYDYGRLENGRPRQLHEKESIEVINVPDRSQYGSFPNMQGTPENQKNLIMECAYYRAWTARVAGSMQLKVEDPFLTVTVLEGSGTADGIPVKKGDGFILSGGYGICRLEGSMNLAMASVPAAD